MLEEAVSSAGPTGRPCKERAEVISSSSCQEEETFLPLGALPTAHNGFPQGCSKGYSGKVRPGSAWFNSSLHPCEQGEGGDALTSIGTLQALES